MPAADSPVSRRVGSIDRELLRGMSTVFFFAVVAALIGAGKEVAIASQYGVGATVDAYQFVFNLAQWPLGIFASVFTATLVPLVAKLRNEEAGQLVSMHRVVSGVAGWLVLPLAAMLFGLLYWVVSLPAVGLDVATREAAHRMLLPVALGMGFGFFAVVSCAWILALNRHYNTLLQAIPALVVLVAVVAAGGGPGVLAWGTAVGFAVYALVSGVCVLVHARVATPGVLGGQRLGWRQRYASPHWSPLLVGMGTLLLGQFLSSFVTVIDQLFAARLETGALSVLGYCNRIVALVLSVASIAINRSMLPVLSRVHVDDPVNVPRIAFRFGSAVFAGGIALGLAGYAASDSLVALLFERGRFTAADTESVARLVRYSMLQVPVYLVSMVMVSALLAQRRFSVVLIGGVINVVVKVLAAFILVGTMGLPGLLIASALVYLASAAYCALRLGATLAAPPGGEVDE